jgi:hypothetical protein
MMKPLRLLSFSLIAAGTCGLLLAGCGGDGEEGVREVPEYARPAPVTPEPARETRPVSFTDVTDEAGIEFVHETGAFGEKWMPESMGSGGGFLDYDGDGNLDIFLVNGTEWPGHETREEPAVQRLFRNRGGGTFEDVSAAAGVNASVYGMGCAFADYDGDGDTDIYVTAVGPNLLFRNDGETFSEVAKKAGVAGTDTAPGEPLPWSSGAAWLDYDRDGHVDLLVLHYVKWSPEIDIFTTIDGTTKAYATPEKYEGQSARLYRNRGDGTFEDVTEPAGLDRPSGKSLGVAIDDFDGDGWMDLVIANDTEPNYLYHNLGDGRFEDVGLPAGVAYDERGRARAGMGIDTAPVRGNGPLSIAIGNFSQEPVALYTQVAEGFFQDQAGKAGLARRTLLPLTFGLLFSDLNLDGFQDLVVANGHIEPEIVRFHDEIEYEQPPQIFLNRGDGTFIETTEEAGEPFAPPLVGRGLACGDYDADGDLDLLLTENGGPARLFRNDLDHGGTHWIRLRLRGRAPNTDALGARVEVTSEGLVQSRLVRTGSSYLSQSDTALTFGLDGRTAVDSVVVRWPSGEVEEFPGLEPDRTHVLRQGESEGRVSALPGAGRPE